MRNMFKIGMRLFIITVIAAVALGIVSALTEEPIRKQKNIETNGKLAKVLNEAHEFNTVEIDENYQKENGSFVYMVNKGENDNQLIGHVIFVKSKGYGGHVEVYVGIDCLGNITGIEIGTHYETAGMGTKAFEDDFRNRFVGASNELTFVKKDAQDGEIAAISGATVTSKAVTKGVNEAVRYYYEYIEQEGN